MEAAAREFRTPHTALTYYYDADDSDSDLDNDEIAGASDGSSPRCDWRSRFENAVLGDEDDSDGEAESAGKENEDPNSLCGLLMSLRKHRAANGGAAGSRERGARDEGGGGARDGRAPAERRRSLIDEIRCMWANLEDAVVRPPRCIYDRGDLLGPYFSISGLRYRRDDFFVRNPRGLLLHASHYVCRDFEARGAAARAGRSEPLPPCVGARTAPRRVARD